MRGNSRRKKRKGTAGMKSNRKLREKRMKGDSRGKEKGDCGREE